MKGSDKAILQFSKTFAPLCLRVHQRSGLLLGFKLWLASTTKGCTQKDFLKSSNHSGDPITAGKNNPLSSNVTTALWYNAQECFVLFNDHWSSRFIVSQAEGRLGVALPCQTLSWE